MNIGAILIQDGRICEQTLLQYLEEKIFLTFARAWKSRRLQSVTSTRNGRRFTPYTRPGDVADSRRPFDIDCKQMSECLERACRENGYRKMVVDTCTFKTMHRGITSELFGGHPKHPDPDWLREENMWDKTVMELDSKIGSIVIREVNV